MQEENNKWTVEILHKSNDQGYDHIRRAASTKPIVKISNALNSLHTRAMIMECGRSIEQCPRYIMNSPGCFLFKD
ncbi:hypothetical protein CFP56_032368 [Quercus suber]|uniref:Uncharacterized protein n=1 Tax=Quercus suber TaxID=58331 RepID=A0AAW0JJB1_QUESU